MCAHIPRINAHALIPTCAYTLPCLLPPRQKLQGFIDHDGQKEKVRGFNDPWKA